MKANTMTDKEMAIKIAEKVKEHGGRTFYVGGYVRDELLGNENKDIDIEVHGITPAKLREILSELGTVTEMGASFGILGLKGFDIDIAQPRAEKATGRGHKDFEVYVDPFIGYENAAKRRDFTINALMEDVLTGEILDYFGGLKDLQWHLIRHVDDKTFIEDPLRVLRAAQFAARFTFRISNETINLSKTIDLSALSRERINGEMEKALLKSNNPYLFFMYLKKMNQLDVWFPELKALIDVPQNPIYHPEGDVWNHTMLVLNEVAKLRDQSENPKAFMLSALCHDFGKAVATTNTNGKIQSLGHETKGLPLVEEFLDRIVNENDTKKYVLNMVRLHMMPNQYASPTLPKLNVTKCNAESKGIPKKKSTNRLFDESICANDLLLLAKADHYGRWVDLDYTEQESFLRERLDWYENHTKKNPEVTGTDLIELGLKPSPQFKEILNFTHKLWLAEVSKDAALKQAVVNFEINIPKKDNKDKLHEKEKEDEYDNYE